jgi:NAD(P)-dependent dehydrogenase (short-subunit alcohol dehydrogenase family)
VKFCTSENKREGRTNHVAREENRERKDVAHHGDLEWARLRTCQVRARARRPRRHGLSNAGQHGRSRQALSRKSARHHTRRYAEQRAAIVFQAEARFGGIDVLVNNAGIDFLGAIEEQDERDYRAQFEVNFFGAVALLRLVLPGMRRRKQGTIVNVSSMDGIASLPVNGYYSSTKFALEGLTESLWQEIEPLGLRAFLVEPGSFRTGIELRSRFSGKAIEDYSATSGAFRAIVDKVTPEMFPGDPERFAAAVHEIVASNSPRHWVVLGSDAMRWIGAKLDMLRAELEAGKDMAVSTDYPGAGPAIL